MSTVQNKVTPQTTSLPVRHLFTLTGYPTVSVKVNGGPFGSRHVFAVTGEFSGERLSGKMVAPSADWGYGSLDDVLHLDVRLALETNDGAGIVVEYGGKIVLPDKVHAVPTFQTDDPRYAWLNEIQAVAIGFRKNADPFVLEYEVYELL